MSQVCTLMYPSSTNNLKDRADFISSCIHTSATNCRQRAGESPVLPGASHTDTSDNMSSSDNSNEADTNISRSQSSSLASSPAFSAAIRIGAGTDILQGSRESEEGTASVSLQRPKGPQHEECLNTNPDDPEHEIEVETRFNRDILIRHLSLTAMSGRLTLVSFLLCVAFHSLLRS